MQKQLVVVGLQPEKIQKCKGADKLVDWVQAHKDDYDSVIAVVRKDLKTDNFNRMHDDIANKEMVVLPYATDNIILVPGYDIDCSHFRTDPGIEYHIMGISTAASVMCVAMSMFSHGCSIKVLEKLCMDRKGLHNEAIKIMKAYMPIAF